MLGDVAQFAGESVEAPRRGPQRRGVDRDDAAAADVEIIAHLPYLHASASMRSRSRATSVRAPRRRRQSPATSVPPGVGARMEPRRGIRPPIGLVGEAHGPRRDIRQTRDRVTQLTLDRAERLARAQGIGIERRSTCVPL